MALLFGTAPQIPQATSQPAPPAPIGLAGLPLDLIALEGGSWAGSEAAPLAEIARRVAAAGKAAHLRLAERAQLLREVDRGLADELESFLDSHPNSPPRPIGAANRPTTTATASGACRLSPPGPNRNHPGRYTLPDQRPTDPSWHGGGGVVDERANGQRHLRRPPAPALRPGRERRRIHRAPAGLRGSGGERVHAQSPGRHARLCGFAHEVIRSPKGQASLLRLFKDRAPDLLVTASGYGDGKIHPEVAAACDFLTPHWNGTKVADIPARVAELRRLGKPIVCNEDDQVGEEAAAVPACPARHRASGCAA